MKDKFGKLAKLIEQNLSNKKEESRRAIIAGLTLHHILWTHTSLMIKYAMMKYAKSSELNSVSPQGK